MSASSVQSTLQTASAHLQAGRTQQAVEILGRIVSAYPNEPRSRFMLGFIAHKAGQLPVALDWLNQAIAIDPASPDPYFLRGIIYQQQNQLKLAIDAYRSCLLRRPGDAKALNNLGRALLDSGELSQATEILRQAIATAPTNAGAISNLGDALRRGGDIAGAIAHYRRAITIDPNCGEAHGNLGIALFKQGKPVESEASIRRAIAINPNSYNPRFNLARVLQDTHRFDEALEQCRLAVQLRPHSADALNLMGNLLGIMGQVSECIATQRRALQFAPDFAGGHSNLLLSMQYLPEYSPEELFAAHRQWAQKHAPPTLDSQLHRRRDSNCTQRIRVGYVSPNFNNHSVAFFFEPVLAAHDRNVVEIFCYSDFAGGDATTQRLRGLAEHWRDIAGKTDEQVIALIRGDRIEILVDLAGHTAENRLPMFAARPAAVQLTWIGYPGTTGMSAMDYRIADPVADLPDLSDRLHTEKLLRITGGCWVYQPPASPEVGPFPAITNGFVTFGSFNNLPKVTPQVIETWSKILQQITGSKMLLKSAGLSAQGGSDYVRRTFGQFGVDPDRIETLSWTPTTTAHLQLYNRVDIALDTFPYNGTTTTCEALWMGVPVITLSGTTHVSRVGAALLTHAGFTDWIATNERDYIHRAQVLADSLSSLSKTRQSLRDLLRPSPLLNATRLARELEAIYQKTTK